MANNNQNFSSKIPNATQNAMNVEFGNETDVNQIRQQIQQAEANKKQASGSKNSMNVEFGNETDVNQIRQQIQQAEANKKFASGRFSNENNTK
ncbi:MULTISPECIES: gamma-type small acid-soluble spore protein [unclassified Lysinibacillus]|uniref:gamma-type small acid-soluble spore protein n=1 Tax=unclassified Lysinibacillus TaxID=2636778 RepID=UPI002554841C|nr:MULTISPECIES: gamma-type small acid-soluble spore protein [unclassified Lysinibacillus]MDM5248475.1 gamma-type small acid-soluble spore protein [Lysinibacillus sp. G4S2]